MGIDMVQNMGQCVNCGETMRPEWKFCIYCGAPAGAAEPEERPAIPSAIRPAEHNPAPDPDAFVFPESEPEELGEPRPKRRVDVPLTIGIVLGVLGAVLVVYMVIVLSGVA
jgi:hypothetical protein